MATKKGHSIIFGTGSVAATLTGMGTLDLLQGWDITKSSDRDITQDKNGDAASVVYYNERRTATLNLVVSGGTAAATPTTLSDMLSPGDLVTLAGQFSSTVPDIALTWMVSDQGSQITASNTGALRARVSLENYTANAIPA